MMKNKKRALAAVLLCAGLTCLCGCSAPAGDDSLESDADTSVNISIPFAVVSASPDKDKTGESSIHVDANGHVTVADMDALLRNESSATQTDTSGYQTLQLGSSGDAVRRMQERLSTLGYFTGSISGIFDNDTETAVRRFERWYGVMQTGIATPTFQSELYREDAPSYRSDEYNAAVKSHYNSLQTGSVGSDVYALQYRLRELGYPIKELTAVYDEQTIEAVRLFGEAYGLSNLSIAYISLQEQLYSESAIRYHDASAESTDAPQSNDTDSVLQMGDTGTLVMQLQNRLISLGYMNGNASGVYDAATVTAVRLFQKVCGFEVTGSMPYYLQAVLLSEQAQDFAVGNVSIELEIGDEGTLVTSLQNRLVALGYASGTATGVYDENTAAALRLFQNYNGIAQTGVATEEVQRLLYSQQALSYKQALRILAGDVTPQPVEATAEPTPEATVSTDDLPWTVFVTAVPTEEAEPTPTPSVSFGPKDDATPEPLPTAEASEEPEGFRFELGGEITYGDAADSTYKLGDTGDTVRAIQERLKDLGYGAKRNGKFDTRTEDAVKEFQAHIGVTQSGEVNATLYAYLFSEAAPGTDYVMYRGTQDYHTLKAGDTGESVTRLQNQLCVLGYMLVEDVQTADSLFDAKTVEAVEAAQSAMGYQTVDGIAGPEFQCFIFSEFSSYIKR